MRINFYLRLFLTFFIFSLLIFSLSLYILNKKSFLLNQKLNSNEVLNHISYSSNILNKYLNNIGIKLQLLALKKDFKNIKIQEFNDKNILNISFFTFNDNILKSKKYYFEIDRLEANKAVVYKIGKDKTMIILYKTNYGLLEFKYNLKKMFNTNFSKFNKYFVFDKKGNYLFDLSSDTFRTYNPDESLKSLYPKRFDSILKYNDYSFDLVRTKKFSLSNKIEFILVLKKSEYNFLYSLKNMDNELLFVVIIMFLMSFFLSIVFSNPAAKIYKRINLKNEQLGKNIARNSTKLNESLDLIDNNVMVLRLNSSREILDVSNAYCQLTKYSKNELIGQDYRKLILPNDLNIDYLQSWEKIKKGEKNTLELKCVKKDGTYFWTESYIELVKNKFGEIEGFTEIITNVTEKKKIQELYNNLEYQLSQYNTIFSYVNSGIAIINLKGEFLKVNDTFGKFLDYTNDEFLNELNLENILDDSSKKVKKLLKDLVDFKSISNIEKIFVDSKKQMIHLEMNASMLPDNKTFVLIVNSLEDKRKQQEINQLLELKIKNHLEKSRQKDKIHQQEQIKNAKLSSIGALAAGITHEINTPLTYIKGSFELMGYDIDDLPDSEIKQRMLEDKEKINDGLNRIANIVESMREISQNSSETKEDTNIYSTLITSLTMAYNRSKQVSKIFINDELFTIGHIQKDKFNFISEVQKQRVEQVWIIIINNALDELIKIQSYDNREFRIEIFEEKEDIIVQFKDNAGGINEDIVDKIFEPFISNKEHSGMGVGLNIAKKIVEQQDGRIKAYNSNIGAVFEIRLKSKKG